MKDVREILKKRPLLFDGGMVHIIRQSRAGM